MIDAGKAYNAANKQFVSGIRELAQQSTTDEVIEVNNKMMSLTTFCLTSPARTPTLCTSVGSVGGVFIYLQRFTIIVIRVNANISQKPAGGSPLVPTNKALPLWFPTTFLFFDLDIFIIDGVSMDDLN